MIETRLFDKETFQRLIDRSEAFRKALLCTTRSRSSFRMDEKGGWKYCDRMFPNLEIYDGVCEELARAVDKIREHIAGIIIGEKGIIVTFTDRIGQEIKETFLPKYCEISENDTAKFKLTA